MITKSMYPCQNIPTVIFGNRCLKQCLYCELYKYHFSEEKIILNSGGSGSFLKPLVDILSKYKGAYFSPVTDCFLQENSRLTHYYLEETWKLNPNWVPLIVTKQVIPSKTINLIIKNKHRLVLQISVPSTNAKIVSIMEPGCASIEERLKMIKGLTDNEVPVIVVIMPWFDLDKPENLAEKLFKAGISRTIIANGILTKKTKQKMLNSENAKLKQIAESVCYIEEATSNGLVLPKEKRVESLARLIKALNNLGIKTKVCISDNHDLGNTDLPLCGGFKHHNFKK